MIGLFVIDADGVTRMFVQDDDGDIKVMKVAARRKRGRRT